MKVVNCSIIAAFSFHARKHQTLCLSRIWVPTARMWMAPVWRRMFVLPWSMWLFFSLFMARVTAFHSCLPATSRIRMLTPSFSKILRRRWASQILSFLKSVFVLKSIIVSLDGIEERYILEGHLGSGTFGEVRLCREIATGDMYAAKIIDLKQIHYRVVVLLFVWRLGG